MSLYTRPNCKRLSASHEGFKPYFRYLVRCMPLYRPNCKNVIWVWLLTGISQTNKQTKYKTKQTYKINQTNKDKQRNNVKLSWCEMSRLCNFRPSWDVKMVWFWYSWDVKMVWFWYSWDVKMVWFWYSWDVMMVWFWYSWGVEMVWFWLLVSCRDGMVLVTREVYGLIRQPRET